MEKAHYIVSKISAPGLQEKAFIALCKVNKWILRREIYSFSGKKVNGIIVIESGILTPAHLAGAGNVKKILHPYGNYQFEDAFVISIESYLKKFWIRCFLHYYR